MWVDSAGADSGFLRQRFPSCNCLRVLHRSWGNCSPVQYSVKWAYAV